MMLGRVVGRAWSDRQIATLDGRQFLMVRGLDDERRVCVAVDLMDAGTGAIVLVATDEAAAAACGTATVDAAVVALVSSYDGIEGS